MSHGLRAAFVREALALARCRSVRVAAAAYVLVCGAALLLWIEPGTGDLATNARAVQWTLLSIVTPWIVSRRMSGSRGDTLALLAAQVAVAPSHLIAGRLAAACACFALMLVASAPLSLVSYLGSLAGAAAVAGAQLELAAFVCLAVVVTVHCDMRDENRLRSWLLSTITSVGAAVGYASVARSAGPAAAAAGLGLAVAVGIVLLAGRADRELRYLDV